MQKLAKIGLRAGGIEPRLPFSHPRAPRPQCQRVNDTLTVTPTRVLLTVYFRLLCPSGSRIGCSLLSCIFVAQQVPRTASRSFKLAGSASHRTNKYNLEDTNAILIQRHGPRESTNQEEEKEGKIRKNEQRGYGRVTGSQSVQVNNGR